MENSQIARSKENTAVLLMEETRENNKTLSHNVVSSTPHHEQDSYSI
jgi:hypothetical protein